MAVVFPRPCHTTTCVMCQKCQREISSYCPNDPPRGIMVVKMPKRTKQAFPEEFIRRWRKW